MTSVVVPMLFKSCKLEKACMLKKTLQVDVIKMITIIAAKAISQLVVRFALNDRCPISWTAICASFAFGFCLIA